MKEMLKRGNGGERGEEDTQSFNMSIQKGMKMMKEMLERWEWVTLHR